MIKTLLIGAGAVLLTAGSAMACDTLTSQVVKLSLCVDDSYWELQAPQGVQEFLYYSNDQKIGFTVITEKETVAVSDYRAAILQNAVAGAGEGKTLDDVKVIGERIENIAGKPWNVIDYQVNSGGTDYEFQNFYYVQPGYGSTQIVYWSIPSDATLASYQAGQMLTQVQFVK